jgi:hypothetical protein
VADTTVLLPVTDAAELLEWLAEHGLRPAGRAPRAPTPDDVRAAIRSLGPVEVDEDSDDDWHAIVLFGPVDGRRYADGFEVTVTAESIGVRGGSDARVAALARALAAAVGPLVKVRASDGRPELVERVL